MVNDLFGDVFDKLTEKKDPKEEFKRGLAKAASSGSANERFIKSLTYISNFKKKGSGKNGR